jgi:hypothetical protein
MQVIESDQRGNPTHYTCNTVTCGKAEVFVEYDYSDLKSVDVHIYKMVFLDRGTEINEERRWDRYATI